MRSQPQGAEYRRRRRPLLLDRLSHREHRLSRAAQSYLEEGVGPVSVNIEHGSIRKRSLQSKATGIGTAVRRRVVSLLLVLATGVLLVQSGDLSRFFQSGKIRVLIFS